jgi:hypothetical protein
MDERRPQAHCQRAIASLAGALHAAPIFEVGDAAERALRVDQAALLQS